MLLVYSSMHVHVQYFSRCVLTARLTIRIFMQLSQFRCGCWRIQWQHLDCSSGFSFLLPNGDAFAEPALPNYSVLYPMIVMLRIIIIRVFIQIFLGTPSCYICRCFCAITSSCNGSSCTKVLYLWGHLLRLDK